MSSQRGFVIYGGPGWCRKEMGWITKHFDNKTVNWHTNRILSLNFFLFSISELEKRIFESEGMKTYNNYE